jgi:hypothetical protein
VKPPDWLVEWQARFGDAIRTPLDRSSGTLKSRCEQAPSELDVESLEGVGVYNRQYWFRLFGVFQRAYPLTARVVGHWHFNGMVAEFLKAQPPRHRDIEHETFGFDAFVASSGAREIVCQAARIDAAYRAVLEAPSVTPWRPSPSDADALLDSKLVPSRSFELIEEHWPLVELRRTILEDEGESAVEEPAPHARWWALIGRAEGVLRLQLEPLEGRLFALLSSSTVRDALACLESECPENERARLPQKTQEWLARSVTLGFWTGLSREERS